MKRLDPVFFASAAELREWLERNQATAAELWVGFRKKGSGQGSISYGEALDEALCFGWIDGVRKSLGAEGYTMRFTPRRANSVWSAVNIRRAHELKEAGRMHAAGLAAFEGRDESRAKRYSYEREAPHFDPEAEAAFRANARAWEFFHAQPAGYQRLNTWWVMNAKREETRLKRLGVLVEACAQGRRLDPMLSPFKQVPAEPSRR